MCPSVQCSALGSPSRAHKLDRGRVNVLDTLTSSLPREIEYRCLHDFKNAPFLTYTPLPKETEKDTPKSLIRKWFCEQWRRAVHFLEQLGVFQREIEEQAMWQSQTPFNPNQ